MADTFTVDAEDSGNVNGTQLFTNIESLDGQAGDDVFNIDATLNGAAIGDADSDTFNINAALGGGLTGDGGDDLINIDANVTGDVSGGDGNDAINLNAAVTGNVAGDGDDDTLTVGANGSAAQYRGGTGSNTLALAAGVDGTWVIDGANAGTLNGVSFIDFGVLDGADGTDTFTLGASGSFDAIDGGGGDNTLTLSQNDDVITIAGADNGSLELPGSVVGTFAGIATLNSGAGSDEFLIQSAFAGTLDGGTMNDIFRIEMDLGANPAGNIVGGDGDDQLYGADIANTWLVDGANSGNVNDQAFVQIEALIGGASTDDFTLTDSADANVAGGIDGGDGDDTLNVGLSAGQRAISFTGGDGTDNVIVMAGVAMTPDAVLDADNQILTYGDGGTGDSVDFATTESVTDGVTGGALQIVASQAQTIDVTQAGDTAVSGLGFDFTYAPKTSLDLDASAAAVTLGGAIDVTDSIDIDAAALTAAAGATITTSALTVRNAMITGAMMTTIDALFLDGVSGGFAITDDGDLEVTGATIVGTAGTQSITAGGALTVASPEQHRQHHAGGANG